MQKFYASRQQLCSNAGNGIVQKVEFAVENKTVRRMRLAWGILLKRELGAFVPKRDGDMGQRKKQWTILKKQ